MQSSVVVNAAEMAGGSAEGSDPAAGPRPSHAQSSDARGLALAALGVIFGDIGTSPLYTVRESFSSLTGLPLTPETLMSVLSLIFWSVTIVVSLKYILVMLRFSDRGEGGVLALLSLTLRKVRGRRPLSLAVTALGVFAAALFFGDAMITPAISVLAAVEGISVVAPGLHDWIVPIAVVILALLFWAQRQGTASVGRVFGPVMICWFVTLGLLGLASIVQEPQVLMALHPKYALWIFRERPDLGMLAMGTVFLCVTGAEAMYADLGHFGRRPIAAAWFILVFPCLLLNYFGQGALLIRDPQAASNPFFLLAPEILRVPLVILATAATIIASQAVISGAFSVTQQASRLNLLPRLKVLYTSDTAKGQIYIPAVNWLLMLAVLALVLGFGDSSSLAAAYGLAVSTDFVIGSILLIVTVLATALMRTRDGGDAPQHGMSVRRRACWLLLLAPLAAFLTLELAFFAANLRKFFDGGWFPLLVAIVLMLLMWTWRSGLDTLRLRKDLGPKAAVNGLTLNLADVPRVPGTAIFFSSTAVGCPSSFLHNLKHNKIVHEQTCFLTIDFVELPRLDDRERTSLERGANGICRILARFGYREDPDIHRILRVVRAAGLQIPEDASLFTSKPHIIVSAGRLSSRLQRRVFGWMLQNSPTVAGYLRLPPGQVIEIGAQVVI
jgi:KUP system potassium uptake protein